MKLAEVKKRLDLLPQYYGDLDPEERVEAFVRWAEAGLEKLVKLKPRDAGDHVLKLDSMARKVLEGRQPIHRQGSLPLGQWWALGPLAFREFMAQVEPNVARLFFQRAGWPLFDTMLAPKYGKTTTLHRVNCEGLGVQIVFTCWAVDPVLHLGQTKKSPAGNVWEIVEVKGRGVWLESEAGTYQWQPRKVVEKWKTL